MGRPEKKDIASYQSPLDRRFTDEITLLCTYGVDGVTAKLTLPPLLPIATRRFLLSTNRVPTFARCSCGPCRCWGHLSVSFAYTGANGWWGSTRSIFFPQNRSIGASRHVERLHVCALWRGGRCGRWGECGCFAVAGVEHRLSGS